MRKLNVRLIAAPLAAGITFATFVALGSASPTTQSTQVGATSRPENHSTARRAMLGVSVSIPPTGDGLQVEYVLSGSPASSAGLQVGDVLLQFDDQLVFHPLQLQKLVERSGPEREVKVTYRRGQERVTHACRLVVAPAAPVGLQLDLDIVASDEALKQALKDAGIPEGGVANLSYIRIGDPGNAVMMLNKSADGWVLSIRDLAGNVVFSGPLNTEADRAAVPEKYRPVLPLLDEVMK